MLKDELQCHRQLVVTADCLLYPEDLPKQLLAIVVAPHRPLHLRACWNGLRLHPRTGSLGLVTGAALVGLHNRLLPDIPCLVHIEKVRHWSA